MQTKVEQFFNEKNSSTSTKKHYCAAIKLYEELNNSTFDELLEEADIEEEKGIRWKRRKLKQRLIDFRSHLYKNKSEGTAKLYFGDIQTLYRYFEIELQPLPKYTSKDIDKTYEMSYEDILTKEEIKDAYHEANNVVKCIILFASSSGISKIDILNQTVGSFINACGLDGSNLQEQLQRLKNERCLIPTFRGYRQKTNKSYTTFCSPEATQHIVQYLIGRDAKIKLAYKKGESEYESLSSDDKLFDISESHFSRILKEINQKLNLGKVGKNSKFRCHALRKFQATTLINLENGFTIEEVDTLQGRSKDKTHRAYFHDSTDKLYKKYVDCVDELMLFSSIHEVDKVAYEQLKKENAAYSSKLEEQQRTINQIISNQRELEKLIGLGE